LDVVALLDGLGSPDAASRETAQAGLRGLGAAAVEPLYQVWEAGQRASIRRSMRTEAGCLLATALALFAFDPPRKADAARERDLASAAAARRGDG
jgi:hypothetical protein